MVVRQTQLTSKKVIVLLAPGFEEGSAIYCLDRLREAGVPVSLVGVSAGLISGAHGVSVRPDCTLGQVMDVPSPKIVFIPDGSISVSTLLADPRVHRLLAATVKNDGAIAALPAAASMLDGMEVEGGTAVSPLVTPSDGGLDQFADQLINLVMS
ncbi:MAG: hypothetical protein CSA11_07575 [Chloroflexi bacterium]|nr:MAG: hypothetical protein CSA11_07575 [Chloroflexota bacterium]